MEELKYEQLIIQGMKHMNELHHLDIVWFSDAFETVQGLINHQVPKELGFSMSDYAKIYNLLNTSIEPTYCYASTVGQLEYIFVALDLHQNNNKTKKKGLLKIGPFLTTQVNNYFISNVMTSLNLPLYYRQKIAHFYDSLNVVNSNYANNLGYIAINLFHEHTALPQEITYHAKDMKVEGAFSDLSNNEREIIENRYTFEKRMRHAVTHGDGDLLIKIYKDVGGAFNIADRFPDNPLRSAKNLAIVLNTIMRIAAGESGLHPVYLHRLSEKFAILIEKSKTRSEVAKLTRQMGLAYIETINKYNYEGLSPQIRKITDYIHFNLDEDLSLQTIAARYNMSSSNLANRFKKEMQVTISEFVNSERIKEACYYLKNSTLSIYEVSLKVGFLDQNYFTRMFKKYMTVTPSQYRKNYTL